MIPFRETAEFLMGRTGERIVADLLQRRGWYVIPSYDFAGPDGDKAPRLQGHLHQYVIPDLDVAKGGRRCWVEVKTKSRATETRIAGGRLEHGISLRHALDYQEVERISGCEVWLAIFERSTNCVLMARVADLMPTARRSVMRKGGFAEGPMVFFARDAFHVLGMPAVVA